MDEALDRACQAIPPWALLSPRIKVGKQSWNVQFWAPAGTIEKGFTFRLDQQAKDIANAASVKLTVHLDSSEPVVHAQLMGTIDRVGQVGKYNGEERKWYNAERRQVAFEAANKLCNVFVATVSTFVAHPALPVSFRGSLESSLYSAQFMDWCECYSDVVNWHFSSDSFEWCPVRREKYLHAYTGIPNAIVASTSSTETGVSSAVASMSSAETGNQDRQRMRRRRGRTNA